jgi:hypothetical protein
VLLASAVTDSLVSVGLELVWMFAVIDVAGPQRTAHYVAIGATLAGVRGIAGPLVGGLVIHSFGIHMVLPHRVDPHVFRGVAHRSRAAGSRAGAGAHAMSLRADSGRARDFSV